VTAAPETPPDGPANGSLRGPALRFAALLVILFATFAAVRWTPLAGYLELDRLSALLARLRDVRWAPLAFVGAFAVAGAIGVPATPFIVVGAAIFGFAWGVVWSWTGLMAATAIGFLVAKALGREFVERIGGEKLRRAEAVLHRRGFLPLVAIRFVPLPFTLVNAAAAVVGVRFGRFFVATGLGVAPPIAIFTYFSAALLDAATGDRAAIWREAALVMIGAALLVFTPMGIRRRLRKRRLQRLREHRSTRANGF